MADANDDTQVQDDQFQTNNPDDVNPMAKLKEDERLPQDYDTPFSPPTDVHDRITEANELADNASNIDDHERYDAGLDAAAGVDLPDEPTDEQAA